MPDTSVMGDDGSFIDPLPFDDTPHIYNCFLRVTNHTSYRSVLWQKGLYKMSDIWARART
jgi:hypothetical protein